MKKIISYIFRASVSTLLIILLLYIMRGKYDQILAVLKSTRMAVYGLALFTFITAVSLASFRLKLIIEAQLISIKFREAVSLSFIGYFFNNFLPTAIGGDVVKAYYLSKKTSNKLESYTAVFVDRVIGLVTMIFMAFVALFFVGNEIIDIRLKYAIYGITLACVFAIIFVANKEVAKKFSILLSFVRPAEEKLIRAYNSIHVYRNHNLLLFQSLAISVVSQLLFFTTIGILAASVRSHIPMMDLFLKMPIISTLSLLPSINGLGFRESSVVLFFGPRIGQASAFAVSVLWLAILLMISILGGIIYALSPQFKVKLIDVEGDL